MKIIKAALALALSSASLSTLTLAQEDAPQGVDVSNINKYLNTVPAAMNEEDDHRYVVKYKAGRRGLKGRRKANELGKIVMALEKDNVEVMILDSDEKVHALAEDDSVAYVERDHKHFLTQTTQNSNDTFFPYGIGMVRALEVDSSNVSNRKLCIVDTGYDLGHEDLQTNNVSGYGGSLTAGPWDQDGHGHGTHVAGTIAGIGNNNKGVIGVVPNGEMDLFIVRVFGNNGSWAWGSDVVAAVEECVNGGSDIVSMSLGRGGSPSLFEAEAYKNILENDDVLLVAAAGNGGNSGFSYPASYTSVMSVGALDSNENIASFSQNNEQVDIAGPGVGTISTVPGNGYASFSGTSMATPHVSGVAALVWSHFPTLKAQQIRQVMEDSAKDLGTSGYDHFYGHGLVDAKAAFDQLDGGNTPPVCTDQIAGWQDSNGNSCIYYSMSNKCTVSGNDQGTGGLTAKQACCACDGGNNGPAPPTPPTPPTPPPTPAPTPAPTSSPPDGECTDYDGWTDLFGDDCTWYETFDGEGCPNYGDFWANPNTGITPGEACCYCGGGNNADSNPDPPSATPTSPPTKAPTTGSECSSINGKRRCNRTEGCGFNVFQRACLDALSTTSCQRWNSKRQRCRKNGCKWDNTTKLCSGRWD